MKNISSIRRPYEVIRGLILVSLGYGSKTINQIANDTNINWRTVELHLTYLVGRGLAREIFSSEYVRIFELTENGKDAAKAAAENIISRYVIKTNREEVKFTINFEQK